MKTVLHPSPIAPSESGDDMFSHLAESALLESPAGEEIVDRINRATDGAYPDRRTHIRQVALVVMRAKGLA